MASQRLVALFLVLASVSLPLSCRAEETCSAGSDASTCQSAESCSDDHEKCEMWASQGECDSNPNYMLQHCRESCFVCGAVDLSLPDDGSDIGVPQEMGSQSFRVSAGQVQKRLERVRRYMEATEVSQTIKDKCRNQQADCMNWAEAGECSANTLFMKLTCAPSCFSCEYLALEDRCPMSSVGEDAWKAGDMGKMFERLTSEPYVADHDVQIWSSPKNGGPWVITLENVATAEETQRLIELGAQRGYDRSADVGTLRGDGSHDKRISGGRTSTNAWCLDDCYTDELAQRVMQRISNMTGIEDANSEYLQLLRYEHGQFYESHHDYITHHIERQQGVRILTFYLYLNDVEEGGGTNFDKLNITVTPKRGRAVVWPSVFDDEPNKKDDRTSHQALPVEAGVKYGANAWFHMRDFKGPYSRQCQ